MTLDPARLRPLQAVLANGPHVVDLRHVLTELVALLAEDAERTAPPAEPGVCPVITSSSELCAFCGITLAISKPKAVDINESPSWLFPYATAPDGAAVHPLCATVTRYTLEYDKIVDTNYRLGVLAGDGLDVLAEVYGDRHGEVWWEMFDGVGDTPTSTLQHRALDLYRAHLGRRLAARPARPWFTYSDRRKP